MLKLLESDHRGKNSAGEVKRMPVQDSGEPGRGLHTIALGLCCHFVLILFCSELSKYFTDSEVMRFSLVSSIYSNTEICPKSLCLSKSVLEPVMES